MGCAHRRHHHGQPVRLGDDEARRRHAGHAWLFPMRRASSPPTARLTGMTDYAKSARGARPCRDHRGRRRRGPPARHVCGQHQPVPVLGVPVQSATLAGMDSLCSPSCKCQPASPVGTLAIGRAGAINAALLAAAILGTADAGPGLASLDAYRAAQTDAVAADAGAPRDPDPPPLPPEQHHRDRRRRAARPHVRTGRGAPWLSLPHPDPGRRTAPPPRFPPPARSAPMTILPRWKPSPRPSMSSPSSSRTSAPRGWICSPPASRSIPRPPSCASARTGSPRKASSTAPVPQPRPGRRSARVRNWIRPSRRSGLPCVLKTTRLGYDGRGQAVLREPGRPRWRVGAPLAPAADPGSLCRFRLRAGRGRRPRRERTHRGLRRGGEPPPQSHPGRDPGARTHQPRAWPRPHAPPPAASPSPCVSSG